MGSETSGQGGTTGCFSCFPGPSPSSSAFCQQVFAFCFLKAQLKQQLRGVFLFLKASKLTAASLHPLLRAPGWDFPVPCRDGSKFSSRRVGICDSWPIAWGFFILHRMRAMRAAACPVAAPLCFSGDAPAQRALLWGKRRIFGHPRSKITPQNSSGVLQDLLQLHFAGFTVI